MKRLLLFFCMVLTSVSISQTVDGGFDTFINGSGYEVTLFTLMQSGTGSAAVLTLEFTFDNTTLSFAATPVNGTDYSLIGAFGSYTTKNITRPQPNMVRVNLLTTGTPPPVLLNTTPTNIITLFFNIINTSGNTNLVWTQTSVAPVFLQANYTVGNWPNINEGNLPVELVSFAGKSVENYKIELKWETATEVNNFGFEVERQSASGQWGKVGFVGGNGNSNSPKIYSFSDNNPSGGSKFLYRLKQIDNDGQFEYSDAVEVLLAPMEYTLYQNYPNPFNPTTKIKFELLNAGKVSLKVFNIAGEEIAELINTDYEAGFYDIELNSSTLALSSGIYFYQLRSGDFVKTNKMILMK